MKANGNAIRVIRERSGVSLRQMAETTSLHRGYLSELERGLKGAGPDTLTKIASALGTSIEAITRDPS